MGWVTALVSAHWVCGHFVLVVHIVFVFACGVLPEPEVEVPVEDEVEVQVEVGVEDGVTVEVEDDDEVERNSA